MFGWHNSLQRWIFSKCGEASEKEVPRTITTFSFAYVATTTFSLPCIWRCVFSWRTKGYCCWLKPSRNPAQTDHETKTLTADQSSATITLVCLIHTAHGSTLGRANVETENAHSRLWRKVQFWFHINCRLHSNRNLYCFVTVNQKSQE